MSKRINELAFKYHIDARTDELSLFVSEIYDDGFHAGKQAQQAFNTTITLRDYFASLAMQSLNLSGVEWETTGKERDEGSLAVIKELACDAYQLADAMLGVRGAEGRKTHCINYDEIEQLLAQPEQEPVYWENEKKALLNEIDHLTNRLAQPELSTDSLQLDEQDLREGLRDHFAGLAMQGLLISDGCGIDSVSGFAYKCADAMLIAREAGL